jgi:hypothetical protein
MLKGDANTSYFHNCANGKRRKTMICSLDTDNGVLCDEGEIKNHIVAFYKLLFGSSSPNGSHLAEGFWQSAEKLDEDSVRTMQTPFFEKEVKLAIEGMRCDSAPGPNGFTVTFFKKTIAADQE